MPDDPRARILTAAAEWIGRRGIARTTIDDVARRAGVGRATVYRYFPGGREQLLSEVITREVARFFGRLEREVEGSPDFATLLERGLLFAHRTVADHELLQKVVETEPERLLPHLSASAPLVLAVLRDYLTPLLAREGARLRRGIDAESAASWLARMVLSFIIDGGRWDLDDPVAVRALVRDQLLAGIFEHA